jgi:hypothetical protein
VSPQFKAAAWQWLYDNALVGLATIAFGAWAVNVSQAKDAYIAGQKTLIETQTQVLRNQDLIMSEQRVQREQLLVIKERQDRNTTWLNDLESRVRNIEVGK